MDPAGCPSAPVSLAWQRLPQAVLAGMALLHVLWSPLEWDHWDITGTLRNFILHNKRYLFRQLVLKQFNQVNSLLLENAELLI